MPFIANLCVSFRSSNCGRLCAIGGVKAAGFWFPPGRSPVGVPAVAVKPGQGRSTYKDAQQVVNVVHNAGLAKLVARLKPVIVIKG